MPNVKSAKTTMTKTELITALMEKTGLDKKQVSQVLDGLKDIAVAELGRKGAGVFKMHGLVQLKRINKPAKAARRGIDPFTKLERDFPPQPAKSVVKVSALKDMKDAVKD